MLADEQFSSGPTLGQTSDSAQGNTLWGLTDHLGSVRDLVGNNGVIREHVVYDSFGNRIHEVDYDASGGIISSTSAAAVDTLFGYTGRDWDADVGLQYNRARWYDPAQGRWLSQDPIGFNAGDSNLYRYTRNRPTTYTDPSGLDDVFGITGSKKELEEWIKKNPDHPYAKAAKKTLENLRRPNKYEQQVRRLAQRPQQRLDYLRRVLMELVKIGDALASGKDQVGGYDLSCVDLAKFNGDEWKVLREHVVYAHDKYPNHRPLATGGVQLVSVSSFNMPVWPGISLDKEVLYGPDEGAIHVLVHEPMHNLTREGLYHDFTYFNDVSISDVVGPYSADNYMSRFITLLQRSSCANGTSVWTELRDQSKLQPEKEGKQK